VRAGYNRQQYLRIKGLSLLDAGHLSGARELLERAASSPDGYLGQTASAWETLADMAADRGDRDAAEQLYRRILREQPSRSGTSGCIEMSLAEVLLDLVRTDDLDEALALLQSWAERDGLKFNSQRFRWYLDLIRVAEATDDEQNARWAAGAALDLVSRGPQLPRHPDVGLLQTDEATLQRLRKLAD
jgi:predicted Zn-dependent protease